MPVVGFCFSFPLRQLSVNHGTLIKWNKGFTNENAVDEDPTELLEAALARQGMQVSACMPSLQLLLSCTCLQLLLLCVFCCHVWQVAHVGPPTTTQKRQQCGVAFE